jgi:lysophospholipase L1-like esterase
VSTRFQKLPGWVLLSLLANGLFVLAIALLLLRDNWFLASSQASAPHSLEKSPESRPPLLAKNFASASDLGPRHQLNYQQWVAQLGKEAEVIAAQQPQNLSVLVGDSLSLWFPTDLLPPERVWLNQGISGETSKGLLKRLVLFDGTQPETIFVMIGINDLLRGVKDETLLANQRQIIRYLRQIHPQAQIVVQSILPHADAKSTWEGRDRLLKIPNLRIRQLNHQLKQIATAEGASYLHLYPLFADAQGNLRPELSTDGLHLNPQGYLVWRSALQIFAQLQPHSVN